MTRYVGCAYKKGCSIQGLSAIYHVCNYYPPGNFNGRPPYTAGQPATACPQGTSPGTFNGKSICVEAKQSAGVIVSLRGGSGGYARMASNHGHRPSRSNHRAMASRAHHRSRDLVQYHLIASLRGGSGGHARMASNHGHRPSRSHRRAMASRAHSIHRSRDLVQYHLIVSLRGGSGGHARMASNHGHRPSRSNRRAMASRAHSRHRSRDLVQYHLIVEFTWGQWGACTNGQQSRSPSITKPSSGNGKPCPFETPEQRSCTVSSDCQFTWGQWGVCTNGQQSRSPSITKPSSGNGKPCPFDTPEQRSCTSCDNAQWGEWGQWGGCIDLTQVRTRIDTKSSCSDDAQRREARRCTDVGGGDTERSSVEGGNTTEYANGVEDENSKPPSKMILYISIAAGVLLVSFVATFMFVRRTKARKHGEKTSENNNGWTQHFVPETGQVYYYNAYTGATTWNKPDDGLPTFQAQSAYNIENKVYWPSQQGYSQAYDWHEAHVWR